MLYVILLGITMLVGIYLLAQLPCGMEFWKLSQEEFKSRMFKVKIGAILVMVSPLWLLIGYIIES